MRVPRLPAQRGRGELAGREVEASALDAGRGVLQAGPDGHGELGVLERRHPVGLDESQDHVAALEPREQIRQVRVSVGAPLEFGRERLPLGAHRPKHLGLPEHDSHGRCGEPLPDGGRAPAYEAERECAHEHDCSEPRHDATEGVLTFRGDRRQQQRGRSRTNTE